MSTLYVFIPNRRWRRTFARFRRSPSLPLLRRLEWLADHQKARCRPAGAAPRPAKLAS